MARFLFTGLLGLFAAMAAAQDGPSAADAPAVIAAFQSERAIAAKTFAAAELVGADELFARAEAALAAGNGASAARLARDARWQLPFTPAGLPPHIARVFGVARLRHADRINALAYAPDGTKLASASRDGTIRVWDLGNGRELLTYRGHADTTVVAEDPHPMRCPAVAFSPDGLSIASSGKREIHIWDATSGKRLHTLTGHGPGEIRGLAFATPNVLVSGGDDRKTIVWDIAKGKPTTTFPDQAQRVEAVAIDAKGKMAATVNAAGELYVYPIGTDKTAPLLAIPVTDGTQLGLGVAFAGDVGILTCGSDSKVKLTAPPNANGTPGTGGTLRTYAGHTDKVNALAGTPDGKLMVTGAADRTVRVWDVASGKPLFTFTGSAGPVTAVAIRPDGKQTATGSDDGTIRLWPLAPTDDHRTNADATEPLWTVAASADGKRIATAGADRTIRVYDAATGTLQRSLAGHSGAIPAIAFLGPNRLVSGSGDKLVKLWDLTTGTATNLAGHTSAVLAVAGSSQRIVSGSVDKTVRAWDAATGKPTWTWTNKSTVCALGMPADGSWIAIGTADGTLTILTPDGATVRSSLPAHASGIAAIAVHPDGTKLATCGGDGFVRLWQIAPTGPPVSIAKLEPPPPSGARVPPPLTAVAFSADARRLATAGSDTVVRIWDTVAGTELRGLRGHADWVTAVAFAPDGRAVYSASVDKTVRTFELARSETTTAAGHTQPIRGVAISRDGKSLATAGADGLVKLWDLATGREISTLTGATGPVNVVGFDPMGRVVAGGDDQRLRWWDPVTGKEVAGGPTGGPVFYLAAAGPRVTAAWVRTADKLSGFEAFSPDAAVVALVTEKDRKLSCAALAADGTIALSGGEDGGIRLWNLATKERIAGDWPLFVKSVADLALTPDNKTLVAIDITGTVKVADLAKRAAGEAIKTVTGTVNGLVMSPTGDRFAVFAADGVVKAYDLVGKELREWKLPVPANAAAFTPDGKKLVTGNADGTAYLLDLP